jgi:hypothetical protein
MLGLYSLVDISFFQQGVYINIEEIPITPSLQQHNTLMALRMHMARKRRRITEKKSPATVISSL